MTVSNIVGRSIRACSSNLFQRYHPLSQHFRDVQTYVKFQKALSLGVKWVWFREYVFPLILPIHTSNPASERINAKLSLAKLVNQFVEEHNSPC